MAEECILLWSSLATDQLQVVNSRRMEDALRAKKIKLRKIDGSQADSKEERDALFAVSNKRGKYPQCFLVKEGVLTFVGLWEDMESMIEVDELPADVLEANPTIQTFKRTFENAERQDV